MKQKSRQDGGTFLKYENLSITTGSVWPKTTAEAIDIFSSLGITHTEVTLQNNEFILDFNGRVELELFKRMQALLTKKRMTVASVHAPRLVDEQSFCLKAKATILKKSIEACALLGGKILTLHPLHMFTTYEEAQNFLFKKIPLNKALIEDFWKLLSLANRLKIKLALENIRTFSRDKFFNDAANMSRLIEKVPATNFGITLDLHHSQLAGNTDHFLKKLGGRIINIHTADVDKNKKRVPPGFGIIDWPRLLTLIRAKTNVSLLTLELDKFSPNEISRVIELLNNWKKQ